METNSQKTLNLVETFSEIKETQNIDREAIMRIMEDVFRAMLNEGCFR